MSAAHAASPVDFVEAGLLSYIVTTADGELVEVGLGGPESVVPPVFDAGGTFLNGEIIFQQPGRTLRVGRGALESARPRLPVLCELIERYAQAWIALIALNAACNAQHPIERRFARWLLLALDRIGGDRLDLTHEYLALMLGVRRASVTVAAEALRASGAIDYRYGSVRIVTRDALERRACSCYGAMHDAVEQIFRTPVIR